MKQQFFFLLALMLFNLTSCDKSDQVLETSSQTTQRVHFKDFDEYLSTIKELSSQKDEVYLDSWSQSKGINNQIHQEDSEINILPIAMLTILNENMEFEIGESIICYQKGHLYSIPKAQESSLADLKQHLEKCEVFADIFTESTPIADDRYTVISSSNNSIDARHQREFTQQNHQPCGGSNTGIGGIRKYVHELHTIRTVYSSFEATYTLELRIKLEYKSNGKWKAAGEQRSIAVNITGDCQLVDGGNASEIYPFTDNSSVSCFSGNRVIQLKYLESYLVLKDWRVNLSGSINHKVMGDVESNRWINSGILW